MTRHMLTRADDNRQLDVNCGDHIVLNLNENPTTGASWEPASSDPNIAVVTSRDYASGGTGTGSGGSRLLEFEAARPGATEIGAKLRRPWDPADKYYDIVTLNINVQSI
jgi:predicted secreted protein